MLLDPAETTTSGYYSIIQPTTHRCEMSLGRKFTLNTGADIPAVGFGTFSSEGKPGESYRSTKTALNAGYRWVNLTISISYSQRL